MRGRTLEDQDLNKARAFADSLVARGVDRRVFSILSESEDSLCLIRESGRWKVFFLERGHRSYLEEFEEFKLAQEYFLRRLFEIHPQASMLLSSGGH
jgi:hypothetical protein